MTKKIRVENADTSSYAVLVQTWYKGQGSSDPDRMLHEKILRLPTDIDEFWVWHNQYLVIKEVQ